MTAFIKVQGRTIPEEWWWAMADPKPPFNFRADPLIHRIRKPEALVWPAFHVFEYHLMDRGPSLGTFWKLARNLWKLFGLQKIPYKYRFVPIAKLLLLARKSCPSSPKPQKHS